MEVYGVASKKNPFGMIFVWIVLFFWIVLPVMSFVGSFAGVAGSIIALIVAFIFIKGVIKSVKKLNFEMTPLDRAMVRDKQNNYDSNDKINNYNSENTIEIPFEFANQSHSFSDLFSSNSRREVLYYDNGKPVYKKQEY
ncbi:MAG: hypothetical protein WC915_05115 [archaeon]|jgi:hypothetical protein